jgi:hypothetical protein
MNALRYQHTMGAPGTLKRLDAVPCRYIKDVLLAVYMFQIKLKHVKISYLVIKYGT